MVSNIIHGGSLAGLIGVETVTADSIVINNYSGPPPPAVPIGTTQAIPPCPYPGLAYFGPDDAERFFGRDEAIEKLSAAVIRQSLTALVGASGSGKSSVVLAGLAPRLHRDGGWLFSYFRIGYELDHDPFLALARALVPFYVQSETETDQLVNTRRLAQNLGSGALTLRDVFAACRNQNKGRHILLIADQFEEAFTLVTDDTIRNRFIDVLLAGFPTPRPDRVADISLMLTLRGDFYGRALQHRPLADAFQGRVENLGPMRRNELHDAIVRPAEEVGVSFDPGLVATLLDKVENKPGNLPLLQFALREMWERQQQRRIARQAYDEIGGIEGALARRADEIFGALSQDGEDLRMQNAFQRLFTRLVTMGEGQEANRRVVAREELGEELWSLAQRMADENNRLVVTTVMASTPWTAHLTHETAEVAHEALLLHWPTLANWIEQDRAFLSWLRQIRPALDVWVAEPSDEGALLRGGMLAQAVDWLGGRANDLSTHERDFIEASIDLRKREARQYEAALEAREQAFVKARRASVRVAIVLACVSTFLPLVSLYLDPYQNGLLEGEATALRNQARIYTGLLGENAVQTAGPDNPKLVPDIARPLLRRLSETTPGVQAKLYGPDGTVIADSRVPDEPSGAVSTELLPPAEAQGLLVGAIGWVYDRVLDLLPHDTQTPLVVDMAPQPDVKEELRLNTGQSSEMPPYIRRTKDNQLLVTAAEPVERNRHMVGVLLLTRNAIEVDNTLFVVRISIVVISMFTGALIALISWFLLRPIARLARK